MRVAIYARKSTDQHHVTDAQKSVRRQVGPGPALCHAEGLDRSRRARVCRRRREWRGVREAPRGSSGS